MRSPLAWLAVATICASVLGCTGTNSTPLTPGSPPNGGNGGSVPNNQTYSMRVLNASPDFGPIDVYVDGNRVWQNVKYGTWGVTASILNAPFYVSNFQPASHNIAVYAAGAGAGQGSQQASVTTSATSSHTTIVVADKVFGNLTTPALVSLAFAEPSSNTPLQTGNVVIHHAALNSLQGVISYGSLTPGPKGNPFVVPTCLGTLTSPSLATPANTTTAIAKVQGVNSNGVPIGYYAALSGTQNCITPLAYINPGSANPVGVTLPGGVVYPSPPPPQPGTSPAPPYDTNSTIPPSSSSYTPLQLQTFAPNTLSVYIVDGPPLPGTTVPVPVMIGTFDPNFLN
jgi:hypothetical protein